jgi:hypothetical protein
MGGLRCGGCGRIEEATMHPAFPSLVGFAKVPWNKDRLIGQKRPLKPKEVWAIRVRLQLERRKRDLALFNLAIDSKLRGCDLVRLRVNDVCACGRVPDRATVIQQKTGRPVQFEITEQTRTAIDDWLALSTLGEGPFLFPSRFRDRPHISTRHESALGANIEISNIQENFTLKYLAISITDYQPLEFCKFPKIKADDDRLIYTLSLPTTFDGVLQLGTQTRKRPDCAR